MDLEGLLRDLHHHAEACSIAMAMLVKLPRSVGPSQWQGIGPPLSSTAPSSDTNRQS